MTYEEAKAACDPFDVNYIWRAMPELDGPKWKYVCVVRSSDLFSTVFDFNRYNLMDKIPKVDRADWYTWAAVDLRLREADVWNQGTVADMIRWAEGLF